MDIKQENDQKININKISRANFSKVCRTCLAMEESWSCENATELFAKLNTSFGFELIQDGILPKAFCTGCAKKINIIFEFKKLCLNSEQILKNAMTDDPLNIKIERDTKTEWFDSIESKKYDESTINSIENIKVDAYSLTPNVLLNESYSDDDITNHTDDTKICTVKEEDTDDRLEQTLSNKSKSSNITSLFNQHVTKLEGSNGYRCDLCGKLYKLLCYLKKHLILHIPNENWTYEPSDGLANQKDRNETEVENEKPFNGGYKCPKCSRTFSIIYNLRRHMRTHIPIEQREKHCLYCNRRYLNEDKYQKHLKLHKNGKDAIKAAKTPCELCGKSVTSLRNHMRYFHFEKNYQCPECDKKFYHKSHLNNHVNLVHKNMKTEKHLLCALCGKTFSSSRHFQCHLADHEGKKLYKCEICNREFKFDSPYRKHMNKYHYNKVIKNFSCNDCGKKFQTRTKVREHSVVHTGEQPYSCKVCERRFSHKASLGTHMKRHNVKKD